MNRKIISFSRDWKYSEKFEEAYTRPGFDDASFQTVNLPHANKEIPYNYFDETVYQFVSCYRKTFTLPEEARGKRVFVDFEAVMIYSKVYLNGVYLGDHKGGYTPFSIELTGKVDFNGQNVLAVMVDSTERPDIPPFGKVVDYLTYGGIYREVSLRIVDKLFIENIFARPQKVLEAEKSLETIVFLDNPTGKEQDLELEISLIYGNNVVAQAAKSYRTGTEEKCRTTIMLDGLEGIKLWDIDNPNLYTVKVKCLSIGQADSGISDAYETRIGFREARVTENGFILNGKNIKLRGLNRHQAYPYVGYAMPERVQKKDADILKYELGLNTMRTSHYPQSRHFLDRCDEIGLLVLEEIPGWQFIGDEAWKEVACENVREMIERDWNRPSVFLWGVRINESKDDHDFYIKTNSIAHELDDTRQTGGIRCFTESELLEDVYTMNDFIHEGGEIVLRDQKEVTGLDRNVPYLVTEFNGHMYSTKRFDQEERLSEHAIRHLRVHNAAMLDEHISGAIGWCAFDYNTHLDFGSGDRICYHGVMDMFRIPKFAAAFYKSQKETQQEIVLEPVTIWSRGERSGGGISPLYVFTNCDRVELFTHGEIYGIYSPEKELYPGVSYPPVIIKGLRGGWGGRWFDGEFVGYIGDKEVIRKSFVKDNVPAALAAEVDDYELTSEKADATRIVYKLVDKAGNILPYIPEYIEFGITGPGELIGPEKTALIGGCIGVWVKTKYEKGEIVLSAKCSRLQAKDIRIKVV